MTTDPVIEVRAEAAFVAHQDAVAPRRRLSWAGMSEQAKAPWRHVATALAPNADETVRRSTTAIVADILEKRAQYFDRTSGHIVRADVARSYRHTAIEIAREVAATPRLDAATGERADDEDGLVGMLRDMIDEDLGRPTP